MATRTQTSNSLDATVTSATVNTVRASGLAAYVGFHVAIVSSSATSAGQFRYAYASSGDGSDTLLVTPDWDVVPSNGDDISVAKNQDNYDSDYGNDFKLLLKSTSEWDVGADIHYIGNGTDHMIGGIYNQAFSQDEFIYVHNGSYFVVGTLFEGESLGGWYYNSNNANSGLIAHLQCASGGTLAMHGVNCGTVYPRRIIMYQNSNFYAYDVSFTNCMEGTQLAGNLYGRGLKFQGVGASTNVVEVASTIHTYEGPIVLSESYGFETYSSANMPDQNIHVNKYVSVNNQRDVTADLSTTWEFHNPTWDNPVINWLQNDGGSTVSEIFTLIGNTAQTDGTDIASALFVLTQGSATARTNHNQAVSNASGTFSEDVLSRYWASSAASTTYGPYVARAWKYGFDPFQGAIEFTGVTDLSMALGVDGEVTTSTAASALSLAAEFSDETITYDGVWYADVSVEVTAEVSAVLHAHGGYSGTLRETYEDTATQEYIFVLTSSTSGAPPTEPVVWAAISGNSLGEMNNDPEFNDASSWTIQFTSDVVVSGGKLQNVNPLTGLAAVTASVAVASAIQGRPYIMVTDVSVTSGDMTIRHGSGGAPYGYVNAYATTVVTVSANNQGRFYSVVASAGATGKPNILINNASACVFDMHYFRVAEASVVHGHNIDAHKFTYHIDAKGDPLADAYDKQQAYFADTSVTDAWVSTARLRNNKLTDKTGTNYTTEVYFSTGVFITNRGTGAVDYMTADDGFTFTPPTSYTFSLTGLKTDSEVRVYSSATNAELAGSESTGTTFNYNYTYSGSDVDVYAVIFHLDWKEVRLIGLTLSNADQSIPIQQTVDRVYLNP